MIQHIPRKKIDITRWDKVIAGSRAETIYAYSWYLDCASNNWSALIMDDYRFVMPIVWKRRLGIRYACHPPFLQQLGVFGAEVADPLVIHAFLEHIPSGYRFGNLQFNTENLVGGQKLFSVSDRTNYELDLGRDYEALYNAFSTNTKRNLKKAKEAGVELTKEVGLEDLIHLKRETNISNTQETYLEWMKRLFETVLRKGDGKIIGTKQQERVTAAALFGFSRRRAIYLLSASSDEGKESRSMFAIINDFIKEHAGSDFILDFEGSNIPSIARFFAGFGAVPKVYQSVDFARFPMTLIKR